MPPSTSQSEAAALRTRARALAAVVAVLVVAGAAITSSSAGAAGASGRKSRTSTTTTTSWTTATTAPAGSETDSTVRRAALRITIQTTSDWAQLDLPGVSAGHLTVRSSGSNEVLPTSAGVVVRGPAGVERSVTIDVVTEVPRTVATGWITLQQGAIGATSASIDNRTGEIYRAVSLASSYGATTTTDVDVAALMGTVQLQWKRADTQRRVLAFTYPWFDERAASDPQLSTHPSEPWRSWDPDDALRASQLARQGGIDGFVMSWAGAASNGLALYQTLDAATKTGGTATVLLETGQAGGPAVAEQWIAEALEQSSSPAFLRLDGVPVVFVFDGGRISNADWRAIVGRLAQRGTPVRLVGDVWDGQAGAITGMYRYNALLESEADLMTTAELTGWNQGISRTLRARATLGAGEPGLVVATVQPGWDDRPLRGQHRLAVGWDGTATYDATWQAALASEPDWVVITSWNEWYEGTGIAPSIEHGSLALDATLPWAQRLRG